MMSKNNIFYLVSLVLVLLVGWYLAINSQTTIILVRHAEKLGGNNPSLTDQGQQRAENLIKTLSDAGVSAIYSTEFCRTAETARPLADELELIINVQSFDSPSAGLEDCSGLPDNYVVNLLDPQIASVADLASQILQQHRGHTVLVAGHSNTVPALIEALEAPSLCPGYFPLVDGECHIPDEASISQFDNLFVVRIPRFFGAVSLIRSKYNLTP